MRDGSRIRERIELSLDGKQVVLIVLGCALVLGVSFWLGVSVGRDLAGRPAAAEKDPIARVDRKAADAQITFPEKLVEPAAKPSAPPPAPAPAAPAPAPAPAAAADAAEGEVSYTVQAGALPSQTEANAMVDSLKKKGLSPYVVVAEIPGKGTYYRVRVGHFGVRDDAEKYLVDFKRETGRDGFVVQVGK